MREPKYLMSCNIVGISNELQKAHKFILSNHKSVLKLEITLFKYGKPLYTLYNQ